MKSDRKSIQRRGMVCAVVLVSSTWPAVGQDARPTITAGRVLDLASYSSDLAPGTLVSVFGTNLAGTTASASTVPLPTVLGGTWVEIADGTQILPAPLFFVSPEQINAQIPYEVSNSTVEVRVRNANGVSAAEPVTLTEQAPKLLSTSGDGVGEARLFHGNGSGVALIAPAVPGEVLTSYLIGLGAVTPTIAAGAPAGDGGSAGPLNKAAQPVTVRIGDAPAEVLYAGLAPLAVGLYQVNFRVPVGITAQMPSLVVQVGQRKSQGGLTMPIARSAQAREFFVAPNGKASASGTRSDPWDLATALQHPAGLNPGDIIWMLGGTYGEGKTQFASQLTGTPDNPITLRQFPGERATINGGLIVNGSDAWYWGFEVMSALTNRVGDQYDRGDGALDGVFVNGPRTRFINLIVHDTREGFGFWTPAQDGEIYGCLVYHNGWQAPDRGHGHGIYTQNQNGTKHIGNNIIFNQFGLGIQAYGTAAASVEGFVVDRNVVFNNGAISRDGRTDNILFGFSGSISRVRLVNNYTYHTPSADIGASQIGWGFSGINRDVTVQGNYWIGGYFTLEFWNWNSVVFSGNTTYSMKSANMSLHLAANQSTTNYNWDNNTYYGSDEFYYGDQKKHWADWKTTAKLDGHSKFTAGNPSGTWAFVNPNQYEMGRGNIVVYNWDLKDKILVDVSAVLKPGASYQIRDAQNYFAAPVASGTYTGGSIPVPMTGLSVVAPIGQVPTPPKHTAPEFGAFVILQQ